MRHPSDRLERFLPDPDLWDAPERLSEHDLYLHGGVDLRAGLSRRDAVGEES